ncbi:hypothetical protein HPP92_001512 [Vanilla planifolia]|uniref:Uncharacterized protein n=1 Tax=Vanilla planifolia TaxID=51239 RepID=A0A835RZF5_VANPL|nr:hypothetical protein HPP92_001512 [Vanilla planifolia]
MASSNILSITLLLCFFRLSGADNTRDNKEGFEITPAKAWTPWKKEPPVGGAMPNLDQIRNLLQKYSPLVYFHPDEQYLPSSVSWFFNNGALLYSVAKPNSPTTVDPTGRALPQGGTNDGVYWLDLPSNEPGKEKVKAGELSTAEAYVHVKPALGGTATDIVYWLFYPSMGQGGSRWRATTSPWDISASTSAIGNT